MRLRAFVDESLGDELISIGIFLCNSHPSVALEEIRRLSDSFLKKFGLRLHSGEYKLSDILYSLKKAGIFLPADAIEQMLFLPSLSAIINAGCEFRAVVVKDLSRAEILRPAEFAKLRKLKVPRREARIFLLIYHLVKDFKPKEIVVDKGLSFAEKGMKRACSILLPNTELHFCDSAREAGLQVADFVAGAARRLKRGNFLCFVRGDSMILKEC